MHSLLVHSELDKMSKGSNALGFFPYFQVADVFHIQIWEPQINPHIIEKMGKGDGRITS